MTSSPLLLALFAGTLTGVIEMRAEQMQPAALTIATFALMMGAAYPDGAWRRALMLGLSVPLAQLIASATGVTLPYASAPRFAENFLALIPAFVGSYLGVALRWLAPTPQQKNPRT